MESGKLAVFLTLLAAAFWLLGMITVQHWALTIPSVLLLGWAFNLDAAETLRRGRQAIIRYEQAPVLRLVARRNLGLAFLTQGLTEALLIGGLVPLLLGPDLWFYLIPGFAIFMSCVHVYGWHSNRHFHPDQTAV